MRNKLLLTLVAGLWAVVFAQIAAAETLTIVVTNVTKDTGNVMIQVLLGKEQFQGNGEFATQFMQPAKPGEMTFVATDLAPGEYAFRVMHDVNDNGELDANFIGIPQEPWAMSNNAKGNFGPPKWADVKFTIDGEVTQTVTLN